MYQWFLCKTRDPNPRQLEHALHSFQKHKKYIELLLHEDGGKVKWLCSENPSPYFEGSRAEIIELPKRMEAKLFIAQKKGPLFPIKRYSQFEDLTQKTRISPLDTLLPKMANTPGSWIRIRLKPVRSHERERAVRKVKMPWFQPENHLDQWESKGWFSWKWRRVLGPLLRAGRLHEETRKTTEEQIASRHEREDMRLAILDKFARPLFRAEFSTSHPFHEYFHSFNLPYLGELELVKKPAELILSAEEVASLFTPPHPNQVAAFLEMESSAYLPGSTNEPWHMTDEDRKRHLYLLGKTGMGKSTALLHCFKEDLKKQGAVILMDPHGDLAEEALKCIPKNRLTDLRWIDPAETRFPLALNPLEQSSVVSGSLQSSALIEMFIVLSKGSWGPRLEYILRNVLLLLIESPNTTLLDLPRLLTHSRFCKEKLLQCTDLEVRRFFEEEFLQWDERTRQEYIAPILNKVGPLLTLPVLRSMFAQPRSKLHLTELLSKNSILLINLSKGKLGEDASRFLGMVFISLIQNALLSRADTNKDDRNIVKLTIDEFQNVATPTLMTMLSESRKYGLALCLANQYLTQVPPEIQDAILGNTGSLVSFRTSQADAEILAPMLSLQEQDLTELAPFEAYAKCLQHQQLTPVFRLHVHPLSQAKDPINIQALKEHSLKLLGRPREQIEAKLKIRYNKTV